MVTVSLTVAFDEKIDFGGCSRRFAVDRRDRADHGYHGRFACHVQIEPEARTRIKSYVTERKVRPVTVEERIAVGATVPSDVEQVAVPSDWDCRLRSIDMSIPAIAFSWWIPAAAPWCRKSTDAIAQPA